MLEAAQFKVAQAKTPYSRAWLGFLFEVPENPEQ